MALPCVVDRAAQLAWPSSASPGRNQGAGDVMVSAVPRQANARANISSAMAVARRPAAIAFGLALAWGARADTAHAQRAVDVQLGTWSVAGANPALYSAGYWRRLWGPLAYNLRGFALVDPDSADLSLYGIGPELTLFRGARTLVPYGVAGFGLSLQPGTSEVAALWNAGLGIEWNPRRWLGFALEASRYAADPNLRGFWDLAGEDRQGWLVSGRLALRWGFASGAMVGRRAASDLPPSAPYDPPAAGPAERAGEGELTLGERVVETALEAMGEPYRWGGTSSEEGFDCSGLVWYSYATHGVSVPRMSRDQARAGRSIKPEIAGLEPGDILTFANRGTRVTHVGLYVGNGRFIHSTNSGGVRIGVLDGRGDSNDRWWLDRWVGARRVLR